MKKALFAVLLLVASVAIVGFKLGADAPFQSKGSQGTVTTAGALIPVPGVLGSDRTTYAVLVMNDDATNTLLVRGDPVTVDAAGIPDPAGDITTLGPVIPLFPGEKLSLAQGVQQVGLRALAGTCLARVIVTHK